MYYMLVACMAGQLDTGQQIATYLLFNSIPLLIYDLVYLVLPEDPVVPLLGQDNRPDVGMATPGASLRCLSQKIQVFQETEEENG
jgi:hypothetical protein